MDVKVLRRRPRGHKLETGDKCEFTVQDSEKGLECGRVKVFIDEE